MRQLMDGLIWSGSRNGNSLYIWICMSIAVRYFFVAKLGSSARGWLLCGQKYSNNHNNGAHNAHTYTYTHIHIQIKQNKERKSWNWNMNKGSRFLEQKKAKINTAQCLQENWKTKHWLRAECEIIANDYVKFMQIKIMREEYFKTLSNAEGENVK